MKITGRIWLLSLIIQPFMFGPLCIIVIPIEIIFSIPGIIIFWLLVQVIVLKQISLLLKWIFLFIGGAATAAFSSRLFIYGDSNTSIFDQASDWHLLLPAPASAILAIIFSWKCISAHFKEIEYDHEWPESTVTE